MKKVLDAVLPWITAAALSAGWLLLALCVAYPDLAATREIGPVADAFVAGLDNERVLLPILVLADLIAALVLGHLARVDWMLGLTVAVTILYAIMHTLFLKVTPYTPETLENGELVAPGANLIEIKTEMGEIMLLQSNLDVMTVFLFAFACLFVPRFCSFLVPTKYNQRSSIDTVEV